MGAKCYACKIQEEIKDSDDNISILNFTKKYPIGKGGYGKVRNILIIKYLNIGMESTIKTKSKNLCYERNIKSESIC